MTDDLKRLQDQVPYRVDKEHLKPMKGGQPKLRVCHLGKYYHPFRGGIETHVRSIAKSQAEMGCHVTVACINHMDATGRDVWSNRFTRTPSIVEYDSEVAVKKFGKLGTLARFDYCAGIRSFLKNAADDFDILHLHVPNPAMCVWLATVTSKIPLVVTYHSDIVKQRFIRKPFRLIENRVLDRVDRIIVATEAYRDSSDVLCRFTSKTEVIPFGLDLKPYIEPSEKALRFAKKLRAQYGDKPLWLCVGRLVYYKGMEYAIRALAHCPGRLMIVGSGQLFDNLKALAESLGVADRVDWQIDLDDDELIGAYLAATALWFPSIVRSEAFGLVQIEAMACGCPVINTNIAGSGVPWVSLDNVSGITVPVEDPLALAAAARSLIENRSLRERLSAGAIQRAEEKFAIRQMTYRTTAVYENILNRKLQADRSMEASQAVRSASNPDLVATSR